MANGATVRLVPEIPPASAEAAVPTSAIEAAIGVAVADAVLMLTEQWPTTNRMVLFPRPPGKLGAPAWPASAH
jgi:hypothetical protein